MFELINQVLITLLSLRRSLAIFNNEPCMIRLFLIDLNSVVLKYYLFMVSLGKCSASCNFVDDLSTKI